MNQLDRLQRIFAMLPPTEAEWLARHLTAPTGHPCALDYLARDAAVRRAIKLYEALPPTVAAKALQRAYAAYLDGDGWTDMQNNACPEGAGTLHLALFDMARTSGAKDLGWRRIYDIAKPA